MHDQLKAINSVIADMTASKPMDRVICGDVGFGKTEVALRASFRVVLDHYQVMVLVPTTLSAKEKPAWILRRPPTSSRRAAAHD